MLTRFILIPLFLFFLLSIAGFSNEDIPITAESAVLLNPITKRIIYAKKPHSRLLPASTAKVMTALIVLKKSNLKGRVPVSSRASAMEPSKVYIDEGEEYFVHDMLKAILMNSGNDASVALAESVAGSEKKFTDIMDKVAKEAGAKSTNFINSTGLPGKGQYSTAYDMAMVMRAAMKYKAIIDIMKTKTAKIKEINSGKTIRLKNHNKALWNKKPYMIFGKTGYTKKAGHCFVGYIQYNRWRKVIVVILKSRKPWVDLELLAERGLK